jgi:hypothetical protein
MTDFLAYAELSMRLMPSDIPKVHCNDERRNHRGHVVANCTRGLAHLGPHTDAHMGARWED